MEILDAYLETLPKRVMEASQSSQTVTQNPHPKTPHFFVVDYLVTYFALSPERAARISKPISHLKSPEKPDAVRGFLSDEGFTEPDIKTIVTLFPNILCSSKGSLQTNLRALRDIGLSTAVLSRIVISQPQTLRLRSAAPPRIKFWMDFFGGDDAALLKAFKINRGLIGLDITRTIAPKLHLSKTYGFSTQDVRRIARIVPQFINNSTHLMEDLLLRTKEFGFQTDSKMFVRGLKAISCCSKELLQKKTTLFKSFGWSEDECVSAVRKSPNIVVLSEDNVSTTLNFLMREAGFAPSYIASNPTLLMYSLEKRLRPRHNVLHHLESKGLSGKRVAFYTAMMVSDNKFVERYIVPHNNNISGLHEAYLAALA